VELTDAPPRTELVRRAEEIVPLLRANAQFGEENRRLSDETIQALADAGLLKLRVPARYGGYEADLRTLVDVVTTVGRGDGATAWTLAVWSICSWLTALFPDEVQDEVFSTPDVRVCGLLSPTGMAAPADGGIVVNGQWAFNTGALHSQWNSLVALAPTPDGEGMMPVMALAPMSDIGIVDDWHTVGLRGTGSVTTVAQDVFIPGNRVLPMGPALAEQYLSRANADTPVYRAPLLLAAATSTVGTVLGIAQAARELFFERLPDRKITYTDYEHQGDAPITHLQVADAEMKADEALFHAHRAAGTLDDKSLAGQPWTTAERAKVRLDVSKAVQLAKESVDLLAAASGASSIYHDNPMQRYERDVNTVSKHAILHPDTNLELYGRILCGLEPNTLYM
jgi:3-hydroxy-9,10-secoandrosta-1,3,5(10)-triene-9,17-dione monooxygenase